MLRTWEELQAFLMAQGLVSATGVGVEDDVNVTCEGIQVAVVLMGVLSTTPIGSRELLRAAQASIAIHPDARRAVTAIFPGNHAS